MEILNQATKEISNVTCETEIDSIEYEDIFKSLSVQPNQSNQSLEKDSLCEEN